VKTTTVISLSVEHNCILNGWPLKRNCDQIFPICEINFSDRHWKKIITTFLRYPLRK
jgi:hypothetical protein